MKKRMKGVKSLDKMTMKELDEAKLAANAEVEFYTSARIDIDKALGERAYVVDKKIAEDVAKGKFFKRIIITLDKEELLGLKSRIESIIQVYDKEAHEPCTVCGSRFDCEDDYCIRKILGEVE